jgi:hypothetical protein
MLGKRRRKRKQRVRRQKLWTSWLVEEVSSELEQSDLK